MACFRACSAVPGPCMYILLLCARLCDSVKCSANISSLNPEPPSPEACPT